MRLPGYLLDAKLLEGADYSLWRGRRERDLVPVLVKTPRPDGAGAPMAEKALTREYHILSGLASGAVPGALGLVPSDGGPALVLEDLGGVPLSLLLEADRLEREQRVALARDLAAALAELHTAGVIHGAVHPDTVLVHPVTGQVGLIGFDGAWRVSDEAPELLQEPTDADLLLYLAPERAGRMDGEPGVQSDLYALGVLLYRMLTGRLPFQSADAADRLHVQLARMPLAPLVVEPSVPRALSDMAMKLLAKHPEERYQSAWGLRADLETWLDGETGADFVPGRRDVASRMRIPETLYGRSAELGVLVDAFERVCGGAAELLLVSGYSGIGKSALVGAMRRPVAERGGYFIAGKFDQLERNIPLGAIVAAFQELVRKLLTEGDAELEAWRGRLAEALGQNGRVIAAVIPEIEQILGPQPPVPALAPAESTNRFNLVFQRFIEVFAQASHPLVLFLDDLQWADATTLRLLQTLLGNASLHHLLLVGAYRDNEVGPQHPLTQTLARIEAAGQNPERVVLGALGQGHLDDLVADTLGGPPGQSTALAELLREQTGGNPFFVIQLITAIHAEGLLAYASRQGRWRWDLAGIRRMGITDNVVDLMLRKIRRLPEATQRAIELGACIGERFDLQTLSIAGAVSPEQTAAELRAAVREGLILPLAPESVRVADSGGVTPIAAPEAAVFGFLHDRVQQAAYALIPDADKPAVHLRVGRRLWRHGGAEVPEEALFAIVGHLGRGAALITDREEQRELAALNLRAGRKAKSSTAFQPALTCFEDGIGQLPADAWSADYDLAFALHLERAECLYLCGDFARAERELEGLLARARSPLEQAEIYRLRIVQYENTARFPEARDLGKTGLKLLGIVFPEEEPERRAWLETEVASIRNAIGARDIADLVELPVMRDAAMQLAMRLLMTMWAPSYISGDMRLTALIAAKMVSLSLRWGNTEESAYGYVTYGATVTLRLRDYATSYAFGRLALAVNEGVEGLRARAKVNHMFSCYIGFWTKPIATCFAYSQAAHRAGLASGDFIYAAYGVYHESWHALFGGQPLDDYEAQYRPYEAFMTRTQNQSFFDAHRLVMQLGRALRGETLGPCSLTSEDFDEETYRRAYGDVKFFVSIHRTLKLQLLYLFGDYAAAVRMSEAAEAVAYSTEGMIWDAWRCFYRALSLAARGLSLDEDARKDALSDLEPLLEQLRHWSESCPENFGHRYWLVEAEVAAVRGDTGTALDAFERAIREAAEHGFIQIEALANECCARFWLRRGNDVVASAYLRAAERGYARWGAAAKLEEMRGRYPDPIMPVADREEPRSAPGAGDLGRVMQVARMVSEEVDQARLLGGVLPLLLDSVGARGGALLLERDGRLLVEAVGTAGGEAQVLPGLPVETSRDLPTTVIHHSASLEEALILPDCRRDPRFCDDPYFQQGAGVSVACVPIRQERRCVGLLYLEKGPTQDAFDGDDIGLVRVLVSLLATALINARLGETIRREVAERRQVEEALKTAHDQLEIRIEERTGQLSRANTRLACEIRERASIELKLKEAKEAAEAASRAKTRFLANMSHELRTPLNAILGYAQILRRSPQLGATEREGAAVIGRSGEHLLNLINDILSLAKIEVGRLEAAPSDFDLPTLVKSICDIARVRAEAKGLAFRYETESPLPALVRGEERWLRQVLLNLLSNATKFTDRGDVVLRANANAPVSGVAHLRFEVEDTGIGIPPEQQARIFEPFEQVQGAHRAQAGTGLGLAISKQLIECMGGAIQLRSTPGEGSLFRIELPLSLSSGTPVAAFDRPILGYQGPRRRILIVDDKADNRGVLIGLLAPLGFELSEATEGQGALERVAVWRPDLVLLDLVMPVLDGFEAARRMRAMPGGGDLVILALSASVFEEDRRQSREVGCDDFLAKPVEAGPLLAKLREHLSLQWVYGEASAPSVAADTGVVGDEVPDISPIPWHCPPTADLSRIQELARLGDIRAIQRALDAMENDGEPYLDCVTRLRAMADEYDMAGIVDVLGRLLTRAGQDGAG